MIKTTVLGLGAGLLMSLTVGGAQALPLTNGLETAPLIEHVAEGCGPGFFRGARGFCRPMRGFRPRRFERRFERRRHFDRPRFYRY